jgi:hypothetical protein
MDPSPLAELLHEASVEHEAFEKVAPPHNWWDWYAAYIQLRDAGRTTQEAAAAANDYMADVIPRDAPVEVEVALGE